MFVMKKSLNFIIGALIIFAVLYLSNFILNYFKLAFPAPILGIILLFLLLELKIIKEDLIKDFCEFILKYMILFFVPAFVGVINYADIVSKNIWVILAAIMLTTPIIIICVGLFVENSIKFYRYFRLKKRLQR